MSDPLAIGALPAREPLSGVELRGRVIALSPLTVADETGVARVQSAPGAPTPALGAWVVARGQWRAGRLQDAAIEVVAEPSRAFGSADSEWAKAQPDRLVALRLRHAILRLTRQFFDDQGFTEVQTPAVVSSPGLEPHLCALSVDAGDDGQPRYLNTSPEYHMKRLLSAGMSRIYQCCKAHRAGEQGRLHQPEFTMLEWYRAFSGMQEMIEDTEMLLLFVVGSLRGGELVLPANADGAEVDITPPWERLSVAEAFERHADCALAEVVADQARFDRVLVEQVEPQLGVGRPTVLTGYPAPMAALARLSPDDPSVAERFEVYVRGVELCNGFGELTDAQEQRARLQADLRRRAESGLPPYPIDERFLAALADGIPPSGGNALGFDRLVMLVLGADRVDEVIAFPADRT